MSWVDIVAASFVVGFMVAGLAIITRPAKRPVSAWCLRRVNDARLDADDDEGRPS